MRVFVPTKEITKIMDLFKYAYSTFKLFAIEDDNGYIVVNNTVFFDEDHNRYFGKDCCTNDFIITWDWSGSVPIIEANIFVDC